MKNKLKMLIGFLATFLLLVFATPGQAAQEGGGNGGDSTGILFKWVHFAILAGVLVYVVRKYGRAHFRSKADGITAAITKAAAAKAEAEKQLNEAAAKLASLEQEVAHFRALAQKEAAAELERLRTMTKLDAEKISLAAKAEIEAAERAARLELKVLAAKLAVDRAESLVAKELTPAVQEAMLNNFVQSLQGRPN